MTTGIPAVDLRPATDVLAGLVRAVPDDRLDAPTPCGGITVAELLDHLDSLAVAFAAAGEKRRLPGDGAAPVPDAARLGDDWRTRIPARLDALATAWLPEAAWTGTAHVGGGEMPASVAGAAAADEVLVHGWDLAVGSGLTLPGDADALAQARETATQWVAAVVAEHPEGMPGLFGPTLPVPPSATPFERLLLLTGRQPDRHSA